MALPDTPRSRVEQYLNRAATGSGEIPEEAITRIEQYLAKIATGSGEVPDEAYTRIEQYLAYIAENGGGGGGGDITLTTLNVSSNGTTNAPSGTAYNKVVANVPNSYAAADEGKVVSNGALVAQTAHATVNENGTIDTTLNNSVVVDVPTGGGGGIQKELIGSGTYTVSAVTTFATMPISYTGTPNEVLVTKDELDAGVGETIAWVMITDGPQNTLSAFPSGVKVIKIKTTAEVVSYQTNYTGDANDPIYFSKANAVYQADGSYLTVRQYGNNQKIQPGGYHWYIYGEAST